MINASLHFSIPVNEPTLQYAPDSNERKALKLALQEAKSVEIEIPNYIGGNQYFFGVKKRISPPHEHKHILGYYFEADKTFVKNAIQAALDAKKSWEFLPWEQKASIFMKAADLVAGPYRMKINAATMLCQSKNVYQAEIDAACEFADFLRFNVYFANEIYKIQPNSMGGVLNKSDYRPLEGFIYALTPFNFTAIAANLPISCAMMGNTVVWKPADQQAYSAKIIMDILNEAGLPTGVINMIMADGIEAGEVIFSHPEFAGIHFTGSTAVFKTIWKNIALNLDIYKSYPRIVGETGGKDFVLAHESADVSVLVTALIRGAFEYQGQKCSAASRAYVPVSIWEKTKKILLEELSTLKIGSTEDFSNFINAVIDEKAFDKITGYIERARNNPENKIIFGGTYDKTEGYFVKPTVILTSNPFSETMEQEIFGPVLTIYVYEEKFEDILPFVNQTSPYALTGAIIAQDRYAQELASNELRNACGNFYINDKPTGAMVGQQPFGGSRMSGTNDKSGSLLNLLRWVSPRTIKETLVPAKSYRYSFLE
jgi:1-pyrroline-5-carboxylate dehydrogenase